MAIEPDGPAPYAPAQTVINTISEYRDRGFAAPFDATVLGRMGVSDSLVPRTLQSLRLLDLIAEDGTPTEQFDALRQARGDEEYHARLTSWLEAVYADVLQYGDPRRDSPAKVSEGFRGHPPEGQRSRMVTLMYGLFEYAGLITDAQKRESGARASSASKPLKPRPRPSRQVASVGARERAAAAKAESASTAGLPAGLVGLLHQIPRDGKSWTKPRRDTFLRAFEAVLDYSVPVESSAWDAEGDEPEEGEEIE